MRLYIGLFAALVGCAGGEFGGVSQQQLDPGWRPWVELPLRLEDGSLLAEVVVIGKEDVGAFAANTEYWYVDKSKLRDLGRHSLSLSITYGDGDPDLGLVDLGAADPPGETVLADPPGELVVVTADPPGETVLADPPSEIDPPDPDLQMFTQPVYPEGGWGRGFERDPVEGGVLFQSERGLGVRLFVDGDGISRVVWYQAISRDARAENITPEGEFWPSAEFKVKEGSVGYAIDLLVE